MALTAIVLALVGIFVALLWMGYRDDRRHEGRQLKHMQTWVRPANVTERKYEEWLAEQNISQWPHEPSVGYDERREGA